MTAATVRDGDTAFLGHPKALGYLAFTEAWERFSYYGMNTLLALYMVNQLLLPGHVENVVGLPVLQGILERGGALTPQALAVAIAGLYGACV